MTTTIRISPPPPPFTGRRRALALAGVALVVGGGAAAIAVAAAREQVVSSSSFDHVREIVVEVDAASIALRAARGSVVELTTVRAWASTSSQTSTAEVVDGVLHIEGDCPAGAVRCSVWHDISVPAGTPVRVQLGAGSVEASGLDVPALDVRTETGSVAATFATPPAHVSLLAGLGSIAFTVPAADYDVDARAAIGTVAVGIPDVPGAARTLHVGATFSIDSSSVRAHQHSAGARKERAAPPRGGSKPSPSTEKPSDDPAAG